MKDAKIELTDKQIMATMLDAEKDLSKELSTEVSHWKSMYEYEANEAKRLADLNYHMKMILKGYL